MADSTAKWGTPSVLTYPLTRDLHSAITWIRQFTTHSWSTDFHEEVQNNRGSIAAWHAIISLQQGCLEIYHVGH